MSKRITDYYFKKSCKEKQIKLNIEPVCTSQSQTLVASIEPSSSTIFQNKNDSVIPGTHVDSSSSILDTLDTTVNESSTNTEWYKGSKLDVQWLLKTFSMLRKIKLGKRSGLNV